jgi:16S rRNA (uracil1498-N3)-methyltransferase
LKRNTATSNTYRFFVPPSAIDGKRAVLEDADLIRQISSVLRLNVGQHITLLDGLGNQYLATLESIQKQRLIATIREHLPSTTEPRLQLHLLIGLMRAERFEWILQKGTEIGVAAFTPMICEYSASDGTVSANKLERWQRIIREAAEQSRRSRLPTLHPPQTFALACTNLPAPALLLWEGNNTAALRSLLQTITSPAALAFLSGPEGGFSDSERAIAASHTFREASLGPRTLRAETAPLVAATAAFYEYGELE